MPACAVVLSGAVELLGLLLAAYLVVRTREEA
jgi:hypothetical protein